MDKTKTLNIAVIGLGVGEQHAHAFDTHPNCEVTLLYDTDTRHAETVAEQFPHGRVASSFDTILSDETIDVISIATYDHQHADAVCAAFEAGKHVFVEKPLCRTFDELKRVENVWRNTSGKHLRSNLVLREAEMYRWLIDAVGRGDFGTLYAIDGDYLYGRLEKITEGWRKDVPSYSVMEGGGVHMIDLMLTIAGEYPEAVTCIGNRICTHNTDFQYDDFMTATYGFPSGLIGRINANFGCVHRHHHVLRVFGTDATFIYDDMGPRLHTTRDENTAANPLSLTPLPDDKGALVPGFVKDILNDVDPTATAEREFNLLRVAAATDTSHTDKASREIKYP